MTKNWCVCTICGDSFSSTNAAATDCGKNDEQHVRARNG